MINGINLENNDIKKAINAVDNNDVEALKKLIAQGLNVNSDVLPNNYFRQMSLLSYAIQMQKPDIVNFLLSQKNIDLKPQGLEMPLRTALYNDNDEIYYNVINKHIDKYGALSQDEIDKMLFACIERNLSKGCQRTLDLGANPDRSFKLKGQDEKNKISFLTYSISKDKNNVIIPMIEKYWDNIQKQFSNEKDEQNRNQILENAHLRIQGFVSIADTFNCGLETYKMIVDKCCEIFESKEFYEINQKAGKTTIHFNNGTQKTLSQNDIKELFLYEMLISLTNTPIEHTDLTTNTTTTYEKSIDMIRQKAEYIFSKGLDVNKCYKHDSLKFFWNFNYLEEYTNDNLIMSLVKDFAERIIRYKKQPSLKYSDRYGDSVLIDAVLNLKGNEIDFDARDFDKRTLTDILDKQINSMDKNNMTKDEKFIIALREKIQALINEQMNNQNKE